MRNAARFLVAVAVLAVVFTLGQRPARARPPARRESYDGAAWNFDRSPNTFRTAIATAAGNTAVWTPAAGKRFRLMRFIVEVPQNAAISGGGTIEVIGLQDATTDIGVTNSLFVPTTAVTTTVGGWNSGWIDLGNGRLSAAINQVLSVNLGTALTTGSVRVTACGTEE